MTVATAGEIPREIPTKIDANDNSANGIFSELAPALWDEARSASASIKDQAKPTELAKSSLPELSIGIDPFNPAARAVNNRNLEMGNPSNATTDVSNKNNYLLVKDQYAMSYNSDHKGPNWVAWQLDTDWLGNTGRTGPFAPDPMLPNHFGKATPEDYNNSGYDRGHNCPSGDRTKTRGDNQATFNMSNIGPQAPDNNRGPWEKLESYSRELARQGKELYIYSGGEGSKGTIGNDVNIPDTWYKVIVVMPKKGMGVKDVDLDTEVIAVEMPNRNGMKNDDWRKYKTTVDEIEKHTGYDFLSNVPEDIQKVIEAKRYVN